MIAETWLSSVFVPAPQDYEILLQMGNVLLEPGGYPCDPLA